MSAERRGFPRRTYSRPVWWVATSPEYETHAGSWDYEPPEYGSDFLYVRARSAQRARVMAIRAWRRYWWRGCVTAYKRAHYPQPYVSRYCGPGDENPFRAVTISRAALAGERWGYSVLRGAA